MSEMSSKRALWEMSCCSLDVVLWMTFTAEELAAELARFSVRPVPNPAATPEVAIFVPAHQHCRGPSLPAEHLAERLDQIHAEAIEWVATQDPIELRSACMGALANLPVAIPGILWAVARQAGEVNRTLEAMLVWRAQTEGLRALAFGQVELVAVA